MRRGFAPVASNMQGDDAERARLLMRLSRAFVAFSVAGSIVVAAMGVAGVLPALTLMTSLVSIVLVCLVGASIHWAAESLSLAVASGIFLYSSVLYVTLLVAMIGGVTGPLFAAYLVPVIAAGMFGRAGDGVRLFLVALACYISIAALTRFGSFQPIMMLEGDGLLIFSLIAFTIIGAMLAYLASLWSLSTAQFIVQAQVQSEELYTYNEKLIQKGIQQVEVGNELSTAAAELLAASHQQASGATEQASAVSEISTTMEELGATARQIALAAEQVAEAARQTLENLSDGQSAVDNSIQAMERIRGRMHDVSERILSLGERSQQIGEIIDLINDLSDETHLLALNAAIEAAGAGEHGRRFAVVAAEVKSLANRALAAAKEVKGVIAEIQKATHAAVLASEEGGKEVERGVELVNRAGQVMDAIVMAAERTAQSAGEISLATAQQQSASEQVVETMREVADVARQTAIGARQMSESAQMLTSIAERLHGLTSYD